MHSLWFTVESLYGTPLYIADTIGDHFVVDLMYRLWFTPLYVADTIGDHFVVDLMHSLWFSRIRRASGACLAQ